MGQIIEMLQVIKAKSDTQVTVVSEVSGPTFEPKPTRIMTTTWPPYGLPLGFTSSFKGAPGVMQSTQQMVPLAFAIEAHPVVHTVAPPIVHTHVQSYFEDHHQIFHAPKSSDKEDERHGDIKGIKESYQILEKRLRAMQSDKVFDAGVREMCLVSCLVILVKFKTPDFDKHDGHSSPKSHRIMYY